MRLTVVGSGDAFGSGGRFNTCFQVEAANATLLIDCGASSLIALKALGIDPNRLDGVVLSHKPQLRRGVTNSTLQVWGQDSSWMMNLRERVRKLEEELIQANDAPPPTDYEEAWRRANGFYQRLRTSWERAVEERLFAGVVERFERDVKTLQLKDVKITDGLIGQIEQGMTRTSQFLHEGAFAAQVTLPSLTEMSDDLDKLRGFERTTRRSNG